MCLCRLPFAKNTFLVAEGQNSKISLIEKKSNNYKKEIIETRKWKLNQRMYVHIHDISWLGTRKNFVYVRFVSNPEAIEIDTFIRLLIYDFIDIIIIKLKGIIFESW